MPNTNFQTIHQMGSAISNVVKQATGRDPVENIDMDYVTVAQNKTIGEMTITGNPASFHTGNSVPIQRLLIGMEPIQSGSGDPSPENIRPISGRTGVRITRTGKNMLSPVLYKGVSYNPSIGAVFNTELSPLQFSPGPSYGTYKITPESSWQYYALLFPVVQGQRVYAHIQGASTGNFGRSVGYLDKDLKVLTASNETAAAWIYNVYLNPANTPGAAYWYMVISNRSSVSPTITLTFPQIELDSSFTGFEPYNGVSVPISFPDPPETVYGGTLDMISGVLTVTHGYKDLGALSWSKSNASWYYESNSFDGANDPNGEHLYCSQYKGGDAYIGTADNVIGIRVGAYKRIWLCDLAKNNLTAQEFKAAMSGVQLVYELSEPQTYQLTPEEVETLIGDNVVYTDGDTLEVMYYQYGEVI